jgi:hypothetical protein
LTCGGRCIPNQWRSDTINDCPDGIDEQNCPIRRELTLKQKKILTRDHQKYMRRGRAHSFA